MNIADFNPNDFHLPFPFHNEYNTMQNLSEYSSFGTPFFNVSMEDFMQRAHEFNLPNDVVHSAVDSTWNFFHLGDAKMMDDDSLSIHINNPTTVVDDVLGFCRDQLTHNGIHSEDSLKLILSHEAGHSIFQYATATGTLSPWQTELCCDAMIGVRAAIEHLDPKNVMEYLSKTPECPTHPNGDLRLEYIQFGIDLVNELEKQGHAYSLTDIIEEVANHCKNDKITQLENAYLSTLPIHAAPDPSAIKMFNDHHLCDPQWTQSEIDSHKHDCQNEIDRLTSLISSNIEKMTDRASHGLPISSYESAVNRAKIDLANEQQKLKNWENTPAKKS